MFENIDAALMGNINNPLTYAENGRKLYQTEIDRHFTCANNYYEIEREKSLGTNSFEKIGVRIDRATNMNTGVKLSDDFKKLIFQKDIGVLVGEKFSFANNIWLTIDNSTLLTNSSSCIVRRCNNVIRYKIGDAYDSEPCFIDYKATKSGLDIKEEIKLPDKTIKVYTQNNEITKYIVINQRFIFGSQVFKVVSHEDYNRLTTFEKRAGLLSFTMELDEKSATDDFVNDIADNGLVLQDSEGYKSEDTPEVEMSKLKVSPEDFEIREGKTKEYSVFYEDKDITKEVSMEVKGEVSASSYSIKRGDKIAITCIHKVYNTPLLISFEYGGETKDIKVYLRGMF